MTTTGDTEPTGAAAVRYWNALNPNDIFVGELAPGIEVYRRGEEPLVVDDTTSGSPELVGALPVNLGLEPVDPDDIGIPDSDPRWDEMSDALIIWIRAVESSSLAARLDSMPAEDGWRIIEQLRGSGYDPRADGLLRWMAEQVGRLCSGEVLGTPAVTTTAPGSSVPDNRPTLRWADVSRMATPSEQAAMRDIADLSDADVLAAARDRNSSALQRILAAHPSQHPFWAQTKCQFQAIERNLADTSIFVEGDGS